mmetsp:Transcript_15282/g.46651  ORF Transcript_15282/g.46651 Transcript_15282/m.46651 type:complete len:256 (+) Transcript_15282:516-1283(+)
MLHMRFHPIFFAFPQVDHRRFKPCQEGEVIGLPRGGTRILVEVRGKALPFPTERREDDREAEDEVDHQNSVEGPRVDGLRPCSLGIVLVKHKPLNQHLDEAHESNGHHGENNDEINDGEVVELGEKSGDDKQKADRGQERCDGDVHARVKLVDGEVEGTRRQSHSEREGQDGLPKVVLPRATEVEDELHRRGPVPYLPVFRRYNDSTRAKKRPLVHRAVPPHAESALIHPRLYRIQIPAVFVPAQAIYLSPGLGP